MKGGRNDFYIMRQPRRLGMGSITRKFDTLPGYCGWL